MQSKFFDTLLSPCDAKSIALAAEYLNAGEVVAIPTETVYGLAADATNAFAVEKIFAVKGRPQDNPLIVHISDLSMLSLVAKEIPQEAKKLFDAFWPGPLTVILQRTDAIPAAVSAGLDTVAVRFPSHPVAKDVIAAAGVPLAAPSANRSGIPSPTTAAHVFSDLDGLLPLILDGGECLVGVESTVITLCTDTPTILRPGFVTKEEIEKVLGREILMDKACLAPSAKGAAVASPGMKYKHYAPKTALTLIKGDLPDWIDRAKSMGFSVAFCFEEEVAELEKAGFVCQTYGKAADEASQAKCLFDALRKLDTLGFDAAAGRLPEASGVSLAVINRLIRAAAFRVVNAADGEELFLSGSEEAPN